MYLTSLNKSLSYLASFSDLPWCIFGDFNDLLYSSDKKGRHPHPQRLLNGFKKAIEDCSLTEVDLKGGGFTWEKSKGTADWIRERLDRAFATDSWWHLFPLCTLTVSHAAISDHDPIKLELVNTAISKKQFRFKFENTWLKEKNFHNEVAQFWNQLPSIHLLPKLLDVSAYMAKWGRTFFHKFRDKIAHQKTILDGLKDREDDDGIQMYFEEKNKLNDILEHEELYWKQRAKSFWLVEGDTNSKYFHAAASTRKKINHIVALKADDGTTVTNHEDLCNLIKDYYTGIFAGDEADSECPGSGNENLITNEQNVMLTASLNFEEFTSAVKSMHPDKASGPDGLNPAFFQNFWKLIGHEVFLCCQDWLKDCKFSSSVNDTTIVLIPKKDNVEEVKDLRPIALCNVLYKIIAKVLANRLKVILPGLISEEQSAFVPGRSITDNVLVAFEILHHMKRRRRGEDGEVALKLDISKAYDRVNWDYLRKSMARMGFSDQWIKWMLMCVTTVSYNISFQGSEIGPIIPKRGLRQGDPLSPYLFLLCAEGLSLSLKAAKEAGSITGCCVSHSAPPITHLLFADDSFLFFKATTAESEAIQGIFSSYASYSGQSVNFQKSAVFFSANVRRDKQEEIKQTLGVFNDIGSSKYLGLPSLIGRSKKTVFRYLKDKVFQRIQSWSSKLLSRAGKAVLIRNVAQSIPAYTMSCFMIPKTLCQEIERLMNAFWWKSSGSNSKGIRWCAWDKLSMSKKNGGLGFRDLHGFNMALLGKQCWNLLNKPESLVARVLKARYYPNTHFLQATRTGGSSYTWSGLWEAKEKMKDGLRWVLGDGQTINIKTDKWLRHKTSLRVDQERTSVSNTAKVCDFFLANTKQWDESKVRMQFTDEDSNAILNTRIPNMCIKDRIVWSHSQNGHYTVKSGYQHWYNNHSSGSAIQSSSGWSKIWSLKVPHRMRIFLWRFCRNNISVRYLIRGKGVMVPISCPMCTGDIEHLLHLFFDCNFAKECWQFMGLSFDMWEVESASDWLLEKLKAESDENLIKIAMVLYGVWYARNKKIFEERSLSPAVAMIWCRKQVEEWTEANKKCFTASSHSPNTQVQSIRWSPPSEGSFKINVDAALKEGHDSFTIGMVLRNSLGHFLAGRVMKFAGPVTVMEAEMVGITEALAWIQQLPVNDQITIESDSQLCVNAIHKDNTNLLELGNLIHQCRSMIRNRGGVLVDFIKKQANMVAHKFAKIPCALNCFLDFSSPPSFLLETILSDSSLIY